MARWPLKGAAAAGAIVACAIPVVLGFALPATALVLMAMRAAPEADLLRLQGLAANTAVIALAAAGLVVTAAMLVSLALGRHDGPARRMTRVAQLGYATPGVVVAIGLLMVAGSIDEGLRGALAWIGIEPVGLLVSGSFAVLLYACVVRFFAVAHGPLDAAWLQMGVRYADPARTLGHKPVSIFWRIDLPLLRAPLGAALALVIVDVAKELPATMILRPFNFDTLATEAFRLATTERLDLAAIPALAIAAVGLLPVILLIRGLQGWTGGERS
jgi:iron(III) transport system permease protein